MQDLGLPKIDIGYAGFRASQNWGRGGAFFGGRARWKNSSGCVLPVIPIQSL